MTILKIYTVVGEKLREDSINRSRNMRSTWQMQITRPKRISEFERSCMLVGLRWVKNNQIVSIEASLHSLVYFRNDWITYGHLFFSRQLVTVW
jgi:hypothetical protein